MEDADEMDVIQHLYSNDPMIQQLEVVLTMS